jgi:hypothetical protein
MPLPSREHERSFYTCSFIAAMEGNKPVDLVSVNRVNSFPGQKLGLLPGFISRGDETSLRDLWIP